MPPSLPAEYRFDRFRLVPGERRLLEVDKPVKLGGRAFDTLLVLVQERERAVPKGELMERVWPRLIVEENNLQVQIAALRKILGQDAIATIPGRGYQFTRALDHAATPTAATPESKHNLPRLLTSFVGRESDLAEYAQLLGQTRLLTLTGIGGCGKTRLSIKLAETMLPFFSDGVCYVDLAPIAEPERVALCVATAFGVREESDRPIEDTLIRHLADRHLLLVLDNCEHLLAACAALAEHLLLATAKLKVLVTSREGFGIAGERVVPVRSLTLPSQAIDDVQALLAAESVRLFVERAKEVAPEFGLSPGNADAIVEICRRLDGIPLALELAAARVKLLSVGQIRAKLNDRFRLLTGSSRAMSRHQTLLATLQWSYEHVTPDEQLWLRRLSVFVGGWTLEAATAIVSDERDEVEALERLGRLVDQSLVLVDRTDVDEPRYRMLETVRQYAQDRLNESVESAAVRDRHLAYFVAFVKHALPQFFTRGRTAGTGVSTASCRICWRRTPGAIAQRRVRRWDSNLRPTCGRTGSIAGSSRLDSRCSRRRLPALAPIGGRWSVVGPCSLMGSTTTSTAVSRVPSRHSRKHWRSRANWATTCMRRIAWTRSPTRVRISAMVPARLPTSTKNWISAGERAQRRRSPPL